MDQKGVPESPKPTISELLLSIKEALENLAKAETGTETTDETAIQTLAWKVRGASLKAATALRDVESITPYDPLHKTILWAFDASKRSTGKSVKAKSALRLDVSNALIATAATLSDLASEGFSRMPGDDFRNFREEFTRLRESYNLVPPERLNTAKNTFALEL